jgi:hypothetical protein
LCAITRSAFLLFLVSYFLRPFLSSNVLTRIRSAYGALDIQALQRQNGAWLQVGFVRRMKNTWGRQYLFFPFTSQALCPTCPTLTPAVSILPPRETHAKVKGLPIHHRPNGLDPQLPSLDLLDSPAPAINTANTQQELTMALLELELEAPPATPEAMEAYFQEQVATAEALASLI